MNRVVLGVLVRPPRRPPPATGSPRPITRAALDLRGQGVDVVFGGRCEEGHLIGLRPTETGFEPARVRVDAIYDRYPSATYPVDHARLLMGLGAKVWGPTPVDVRLARDKVRSQVALAQVVPMPPMESDPRRFRERLATWERAFLKPRYGSFGTDVRCVVEGDSLPTSGAWILQRAVPPLPGFAGVCVRVLAQRTRDGIRSRTPVARVSKTDVVVNRARGAAVYPAKELGIEDRCRSLAEQVLANTSAIELGVDIVIGPDTASVIEINGRPRGRLGALAEQPAFLGEHRESVAAPLKWLVDCLHVG